jgi:hypothetical protein
MASRSVFSRQRILALFVMIAFALPIILTTIETASADIPKPDGTPLLIITGKITKTNVGGEAQLDRKTLQSIGMEKLTTAKPCAPRIASLSLFFCQAWNRTTFVLKSLRIFIIYF